MATLRSEPTASGGLLVFDDRDPLPVHFADGQYDEAIVSAVLQVRQTARLKAAMFDKMRAAEARIQAKIAGLFDDALVYVEAHYPDVTADQLKAAFVGQLKAWLAAWDGN